MTAPSIHAQTLTALPQLARFLTLLAWCEGTLSGLDSGYGVIVSGVDGPETFTDYTHHPFATPSGLNRGRNAKLVRPGPPPLYSSASGRYQIIFPTYVGLARRLGTGADFGHDTQDKMAQLLITDAKGMDAVLAEDIAGACSRIHEVWASIPGSTAGQGGKTLLQVQNYYHYLTQQETPQ